MPKLLPVALLAVFALAFVAADKPADEAKETEEGRLKKLLIERRDALQDLLKTEMERAAAGQGTVESILADLGKLTTVELELAETPAARVAVRESAVKIAKVVERRAEAQFEVGTVSRVEVGKAKDARLEAEIELLREKMKAKKADKPADRH